MSAADRLPSSIEALTDKETEILRLLTAGHTVKTIAARLGRSEASINERLRDARRKTGVGSSRELARHLAAQKNWDRKIDLSAPGSSADGPARPPMLWRLTSKGSIIMLFSIAAAAAAGIVFAASGSTDQAAPPPAAQAAASSQVPLVVGKWALDTARLPAEGRPRSVTLEFRVSGEVWTGQSDIVAADGSRQHAETTAAADGVPVALTGNMAFADRVSMRQPAPNTLVLTFTKDGDPVSTRVYTVETDGNSMKETIVWAGDVTPRMVTTYFNRVG